MPLILSAVLGVNGLDFWIAIVAVLLAVNALLWLFLPFVLIARANTIIRSLKAIEQAVERSARPGDDAPRSSVKYERSR